MIAARFMIALCVGLVALGVLDLAVMSLGWAGVAVLGASTAILALSARILRAAAGLDPPKRVPELLPPGDVLDRIADRRIRAAGDLELCRALGIPTDVPLPPADPSSYPMPET